MLASHCFGPRALAALHCFQDGVVLFLAQEDHLRGAGQVGTREHQGAGGGKRKRLDVLNGTAKHGALGQTDQLCMKTLVQFHICAECIHCDVLDCIQTSLHFTNTLKLFRLCQSLCGESRGSSFQHTPKFDRVPDVAHGELANPVATCTSCIKEALVRKSAQG